jgi:hypothetical protein
MFKNLSKTTLLVLASSALVVACGCAKKKQNPDLVSAPLPPAQASLEIGKAFEAPSATAQPEIRQKADLARKALARKDLPVAYDALIDLKSISPSLTLQEDMAVRNAILGLVREVCVAAAAGDPQAKQLAQRMRQTQ